MRLFDTHAHLDEVAFEPDLAEVLQRATDAGVESIATIGTTLDSSRRAVELAEAWPQVRAVVGIQPNYAGAAGETDWQQIVELSTSETVIAIGETGLDRYWDFTPIELQEQYFHLHLRLARERDLPFVVHCREAESDVVRVLEQHFDEAGPLRGIMHSFVGDLNVARRCLELGLHISFAGMVTFKKNVELREVAAEIPLERLLIETDAPYLAPVPVRGKRNEPAYVRHTAQCLADVRSETLETLVDATRANARRLFRLDDDVAGP